MGKINILDSLVANQIAAGEVVEHPSSVLKELMENSLDAGATDIKVTVESGGKRLIKISDNGEGMDVKDAEMCLHRHATSKIKSFEDLHTVKTLGFRGEALASIASVSKIEMITKTKADQIAVKLINEPGKLVDIRQSGGVDGTTIIVRDLFFNTPARRKFMRSEATENYHLTNIITYYGIVNFEKSFTLRLPFAKTLKERIYQIFGSDVCENLIAINNTDQTANLSVSGYVSVPKEKRNNKESQYFFINNRYVKDKIISQAINESFKSLMPADSYPAAFVFIQIPHDKVDVNVHPAKTEVKFQNSYQVKILIQTAVEQSFGLIKTKDEPSPEQIPQQPSALTHPSTVSNSLNTISPDSSAKQNNSGETKLLKMPVEKETVQRQFDFVHAEFDNRTKPFEENQKNSKEPVLILEDLEGSGKSFVNQFDLNTLTIKSEQTDDNKPDDEPTNVRFDDKQVPSLGKITKKSIISQQDKTELYVIGQMHKKFILCGYSQGLLIIDQHLAHERILFDKLQSSSMHIKSTPLLIPEVFDLPSTYMVAFEAVEPQFSEYGIEAVRLSGNSIAVKAFPIDMAAEDVKACFIEFLDKVVNFKNYENNEDYFKQTKNKINQVIASKGAIKRGVFLSVEKMQWLIDCLMVTSMPETSIKGRSMMLKLSAADMDKLMN